MINTHSNTNDRPVYEVIADYPNNKDFPVGDKIYLWPWMNFYWSHTVIDCQGERRYLNDFFERYPNIFKRITNND